MGVSQQTSSEPIQGVVTSMERAFCNYALGSSVSITHPLSVPLVNRESECQHPHAILQLLFIIFRQIIKSSKLEHTVLL